FFFFFSSRRRHTRFSRDWSSDVCSSDLQTLQGVHDAKITLETTKIAKVLEKYHGDKVMDLYTAWTDTWLSEEHQTWNIEHFIPQIKVPVFVFQGENDEFGSINQVHAFDTA